MARDAKQTLIDTLEMAIDLLRQPSDLDPPPPELPAVLLIFEEYPRSVTRRWAGGSWGDVIDAVAEERARALEREEQS